MAYKTPGTDYEDPRRIVYRFAPGGGQECVTPCGDCEEPVLEEHYIDGVDGGPFCAECYLNRKEAIANFDLPTAVRNLDSNVAVLTKEVRNLVELTEQLARLVGALIAK